MDHLIIREHSRFNLITLICTLFYNLEKKMFISLFFFNRYLWNIYNTMNTVFDFFFLHENLLCFFFQSQDLDILCIIHVYSYMNLCCLVYLLYSFGHQSNVCACCPHLLHGFKFLEGGAMYMFKRRFWNQITLAFSLVRGQWDIVFICLDLVGLIYFSVLSLIS